MVPNEDKESRTETREESKKARGMKGTEAEDRRDGKKR